MRKRSFLSTLVIGFLVLFFGSYYMDQEVKKSDSYKVAYRFLEVSPVLLAEIGEIKEIQYYSFGHTMIDRGSSGYAEYRFDVKNDRNMLKAYLELKKRLGEWAVVNAILENSKTGERVSLIRTNAGRSEWQ